MSYPFIQATHSSAGPNLPATRVVIHGTVSATVAGGALGVARYFQSPNSGGSAQYVVDPTAVVQCATDDTVCWHAPPNPGSIGVEFCDWVNWHQPASGQPNRTVADVDPFWQGKTEAQFNARWSLKPWDDMLRLGADLVHNLGVKYGIPLTKISVAQLLAGGHGICGHVDVAQAWHQSDHTDPGTSFPWATFMAYVLGNTPVTPPKPEEDEIMFFIRSKTGAIVLVGPKGPKAMTPSGWKVWTNLGYKVKHDNLDAGPFGSLIADLGGLI